MPPSASTDVADVLDRLGLRVEGQALNAAVVVFGRRMLPHYTQCQLRMARFRGADKTEFLDQRQTNGHALQLLEEASQFLIRHLPVAGRIEPGLFERADAPLFPPVALREALVNAFCHRDYSIVGGSVSLGIYDDRLEIWSDGTLPFGLSVDDLKRDHLSRPRNPLIAEVFYRRGTGGTMGSRHPEDRRIMRPGRASSAGVHRTGRRRGCALPAEWLYCAAPGRPRSNDTPAGDLAGTSWQAGGQFWGPSS